MRWIRTLGAIVASVALSLLAALVLTVAALRAVPPPTTAFMLQSPVQPVAHDWVPAADIADAMRRAVVASEDQRFFEHRGFDLEAIRQAREAHARGGRLRGASTISQQVAKNLFLTPDTSYLRKLVEAGITVIIEALWSKERILEVYLNIAEFGPGIYGVEAASRHWFGKPARALSADEAARLAAVLPSPRRWQPEPASPYVAQRSRWILGQMGALPAAERPPAAEASRQRHDSDDDRVRGADTAPTPFEPRH